MLGIVSNWSYKCSRISIIQISIIWTIGYLNATSNFKITRQFDIPQNQVLNEMSVWSIDLLGLLYHNTVDRKAY